MTTPTAISEMPLYLPWDIVAVPFPFVDRAVEKKRPALVVSNKRLAVGHGLYWLVMITSADNPSWPDDVPVPTGRKSGLSSPSVIRCAKIATLDEARILRRLGSLDEKTRAGVKKRLKDFSA